MDNWELILSSLGVILGDIFILVIYIKIMVCVNYKIVSWMKFILLNLNCMALFCLYWYIYLHVLIVQ
jgi:hypothetical protein